MVCVNFYRLDTRARVCGGWSVFCCVCGRVVLGQLFNRYGTRLIERPTEPENLRRASELFLVNIKKKLERTW